MTLCLVWTKLIVLSTRMILSVNFNRVYVCAGRVVVDVIAVIPRHFVTGVGVMVLIVVCTVVSETVEGVRIVVDVVVAE